MKVSSVTAADLRQQCQYGIIEDRPVPTAETKQKFQKLFKSKGNKSFRPSAIFNVICLQDDCAQSTSWQTRHNFRNFRGMHWNIKHNDSQSTKCKVVSFFTTESKDGVTNVNEVSFRFDIAFSPNTARVTIWYLGIYERL